MSKKILVADDSLTIRKVVELTFLGADQEIVTAASGEQAMKELTDDVDLFILDVHMPDGSGYELCEQAKAERPDLPVVLLVGTFEQFDEGKMQACGADRVLRKPFDSQELASLVGELTGGLGETGEEAEPDTEAERPLATASPVEEVAGEEASSADTTEAAAESGDATDEEAAATAAEAEVMVDEEEPSTDGSEETGEAVEPSTGPAVDGLSDEDVERLARRVVELLSDDIVRRVAWEVVPELAEIVVKERLEELESELSDS
jgi:CheY-like chemotaxis protein